MSRCHVSSRVDCIQPISPSHTIFSVEPGWSGASVYRRCNGLVLSSHSRVDPDAQANICSAQQLIECGLKAMSQSDLLSCKETGFLFARKTDKWSNRESILFICHFALGASYGVEFLRLFGDKLSPFWFGHEAQREHRVLAPLDNFLTCDRVKKLSSSECKKINDTFLALWVSEINSNSRVLTHYFSVPDFALTKLLTLSCSALAALVSQTGPRWPLWSPLCKRHD